jgi:hypothetical protein
MISIIHLWYQWHLPQQDAGKKLLWFGIKVLLLRGLRPTFYQIVAMKDLVHIDVRMPS